MVLAAVETVSITETELPSAFATYTYLPSGVTAKPAGSLPQPDRLL